VSAGRNITFNSNTFIDVGSGMGTVTAGGNLTMTSALPDQIFTAGGAIALSTGPAATMTLATSGATAVSSNGGNISLTADTLNINQGVNATNTECADPAGDRQSTDQPRHRDRRPEFD
jgi:hypothetical protein